MFEVNIQFDGSCLGNPGPGGYAAVVECKGTENIAAGHEEETTNNVMELMGLMSPRDVTHDLTIGCSSLRACACDSIAWLSRPRVSF